jgi:SAM-dependent methyltransferase
MAEYHQSKNIENEAERLRLIGLLANQASREGLTAVAGSGIEVKRVLVAGCGTGDEFGVLTEVFDDVEIVGVDQSDKALAKAKERKTAAVLIQSDLAEISLNTEVQKQGLFDLYFVRQTLLHVPDPAKIIAEAKKVVRPGGIIFVQEPDWDEAKANWGDFETFKTVITQGMLANGIDPFIGKKLTLLLQGAELEDISSKSLTTKVSSSDETWSILDFLVEVAQHDMRPFLTEHGVASVEELQEKINQARKLTDNYFITPAWVMAYGKV